MAKTLVQYTGRDDLRILDASDLKKAGVEGFSKTSFARGQAVEVEKEVADALTAADSELFSDFKIVERDAPEAEKATNKPSK